MLACLLAYCMFVCFFFHFVSSIFRSLLVGSVFIVSYL